MQAPALSPSLASRLARVALANVCTEYPNKPDHVLAEAERRPPRPNAAPRVLRQLRLALVRAHALVARADPPPVPGLPERAAIDRVLDDHLDAETGRRRMRLPGAAGDGVVRATLRLGVAARARARARLGRRPDAQRWARALRPLADVFAARFVAWLPRAHYPIRYGMHANTAFGLAFAHRLRARGRRRCARARRAPRARRRGTAATATRPRRGSPRAPTSSRRRSSRPTSCGA